MVKQAHRKDLAFLMAKVRIFLELVIFYAYLPIRLCLSLAEKIGINESEDRHEFSSRTKEIVKSTAEVKKSFQIFAFFVLEPYLVLPFRN